ncbi:MAG: glycosyl hydrolase family 28-related protein, partial [Candidatus Acidiferrales bacterium]
MALVTATQAQDVAASTFAGKNYNSIQFRATRGGVAIGSLAIDNNGQVTGTEYAPYKAIDGSTYPGFSWLYFQLPDGGPSPYLSIPASGSNVNQYGFGSPAGLFVLDSRRGSSIGMPKGSSKLFDESWAGTYSLLYYQKTAAQTDSTGVEEGNVSGGMGQITVDSFGNLTIVDGQGNQVSGSLQPIADDLALYSAGNTTQFADPCFGMFTFHISVDASGSPVSQDAFVSFRPGAVLLALFSTAAPISPANPYNYLYGIALATPNSYIRSGISGSGPASAWSIPSNSGGGSSSSTDGTTVTGTTVSASGPIVNPLDPAYGAKGDGSTDDRAAIQAALNAVPSGGTVYFPAGHTFEICSATSPGYLLTWPRNVSIDGFGVIQICSGIGNYNTLFNNTVGLVNVTVQNITVDGNAIGNPVNSDPTGVNAHQTFQLSGSGVTGTNVTIQNVKFINGNDIQTIALNNCNGCTIANNHWSNYGIGGTFDHDSSEIYLTGTGGTVTGNIFAAAGLGVRTAIEVHQDSKLVTGNIVTGYRICIITSANQAVAHDISIQGNTCSGVYQGVLMWAVDGSYSGMSVTTNQITINRNGPWTPTQGESGIAIYPASSYGFTDLHISG